MAASLSYFGYLILAGWPALALASRNDSASDSMVMITPVTFDHRLSDLTLMASPTKMQRIQSFQFYFNGFDDNRWSTTTLITLSDYLGNERSE
jgi:hypothetical protein